MSQSIHQINFKASPKQAEAWRYLTDHETTELGYGGAAYGGKSYLGSFWQLAQRLAYAETTGFIGRRELSNLKRTTLLTFFKVCSEHGILPDKHFTYNQQNNTITFFNGSIIFLVDLSWQPSDPLYTRLGGLELTDGFIDESNEVPEQAVQIIKTRIGRRNNEKYDLYPKLLETFNPSKDHVYRRYYKPWKEGTLPSHVKFIKALPTDNPHATREYLNQLLTADKVTKERLYFGNFEYDDDPSALLEYDAIIDLFTNPLPQVYENYLTADVARYGGDKIVIYVWNGWKISEIHWFQKQDLVKTAQTIRDLAFQKEIPYSHIVVDEDGVGGGVVDMLKGIKGFTANSSPIPRDGEKQNYDNLKSQCGFMLADKINKRQIGIQTENLQVREWIIEELEQLKVKDLDKDGKKKLMPKDEIKEHLGRSPDFLDAMIMRMYLEVESPALEIAVTYNPGMTF